MSDLVPTGNLQIDATKIATEALTTLVKDLMNAIPAFATKKLAEHRAKTGTLLAKYLATISGKLYRVKTLISQDEPVPIDDIYVPLNVSSQHRLIEKATGHDLLEVSRLLLITGTAGSGKSTAFRHYFLEHLMRRDSIPIFVNLRDANEGQLHILELIQFVLHKHSDVLIEMEHVQLLLKSGKVALYLDGLDEVIDPLREQISKEIMDMALRLESLVIFVSSRPIDHKPWEQFACFSVRPLTKNQAKAVIERLQFDSEIKDKFHGLLEKVLFNSHHSFASNPLLLTLMLLMFAQSAEIPKSWHLFYEMAFQTLYNRHDAGKPGGYSRVYKSALDLGTFKKVYAAVSLVCHLKGLFSGTEQQWKGLCEKAQRLVPGVLFDVDFFIADLEKNVCLLMADGLELRVTHKTFVEHFAAFGVATLAEPDQKKQLIDLFSESWRSPAFLSSLFAADQHSAEQLLLLPLLERARSELGGQSFTSAKSRQKFMRMLNLRLVAAFGHYAVEKWPLAYEVFHAIKSAGLYDDLEERVHEILSNPADVAGELGIDLRRDPDLEIPIRTWPKAHREQAIAFFVDKLEQLDRVAARIARNQEQRGHLIENLLG